MMGLAEEQIALTDKVKRYKEALGHYIALAAFLISNPLSELFVDVFMSKLTVEERRLMGDVAGEIGRENENERNNH